MPMTMKRTSKIIVAFIISALTIYGLHNIQQNHRKLNLQKIQIQSTELRLKTLQSDYDSAIKQVEEGKLTEQQLKDLQQKLEQLEKEKKDLQNQLQAKANKNRVYAEAPPQTSINGCGDNVYAHYIYMKESGCRTTALNSLGCYGIGQSCPASKIAHCGADYACQNAWFTDYAVKRYGGWQQAYQFWISHHWW